MIQRTRFKALNHLLEKYEEGKILRKENKKIYKTARRKAEIKQIKKTARLSVNSGRSVANRELKYLKQKQNEERQAQPQRKTLFNQ